MKKFPPNAYPHALMAEIMKDYDFRGLFYLDTYPFTEPMVFIIDPSVEIQTQRFPRHPVAKRYLRGLAGTKGLFSTEGVQWQAQRSWFSPAFSLSNITTLVAGMAEETLVFKEKLTELAMSGKTFSLLEVVTPLTVDIIVRSVCDKRLQSQTQRNAIAQGFHSVINWIAGEYDGILRQWIGPLMMDWHMLKLNKLLKRVIKERYASRSDDKPKKIILDLALQGYQKEHGKQANASQITSDDEFMQIALDKYVSSTPFEPTTDTLEKHKEFHCRRSRHYSWYDNCKKSVIVLSNSALYTCYSSIQIYSPELVRILPSLNTSRNP